MKHLINNTTQGTDIPWVTLDSEEVHYSGLVEAEDPNYVDLGLPSGLLWAKCNVGATTETDYGLLFQWGATEGHDYDTDAKDYTSSNTCPWGLDTPPMETLDAEHDAVTKEYGTGYCMPTKEQIEELTASTTSEWVTDFNGSGVNGRKFINKTDASKYIFIPAGGGASDKSVNNRGSYGYVWSSSLDTNSPSNAWHWYFSSDRMGMTNYRRYRSYSVRGVVSK